MVRHSGISCQNLKMRLLNNLRQEVFTFTRSLAGSLTASSFTGMMLLVSFMVCLYATRVSGQKVLAGKPPAVLLLFPDFMCMENLNSTTIPAYGLMTEQEKDSARFFASSFVQYLDDSIVLDHYFKSLRTNLQGLGFKVFTESMLDSFLVYPGRSWVFSLAQCGLEENIRTFYDSDEYDDVEYYSRHFELKVVALNSWFELTEPNSDKSGMKVLFSAHTASDQVKGRFRRNPLWEDVTYRYTLREINLQDVDGLAEFSGEKNASYLYDYWMNEQLMNNDAIILNAKTYWHYDPVKNKLVPAGEEKFIELSDSSRKN
jgi:hypothetical protein